MLCFEEARQRFQKCTLAGCCDPCNEKALRASRGAAFKLPLASGDWQVSGRQAVHLHGLRGWPIAELGLLSLCKVSAALGRARRVMAVPVAVGSSSAWQHCRRVHV